MCFIFQVLLIKDEPSESDEGYERRESSSSSNNVTTVIEQEMLFSPPDELKTEEVEVYIKKKIEFEWLHILLYSSTNSDVFSPFL